jgi:hypothetical protein
MTVRRHVTAVRPYQFENDIRVRMFAHLESAGLELATRHIIPPGTADDEALSIVLTRPSHVFLVPFHAHRDAHGARLTGLDFLKRMNKDAPELARCPVLMPVTGAAEAVVDAYVSSKSGTGNRVLVLPEKSLSEAGIADDIRRHVEDWPSAL